MNIKKTYYKALYKIFGFDEWHLSTGDERPYAKDVIRYINSTLKKNPQHKKKYVIEVGCGLGEIVSEIQVPNRNKIGFDISSKVIRGARVAHPFMRFKVGSFQQITKMNISFLICVDFMFELNYEELENNLYSVVKNNSVEYVVLDKVSSPPYRYAHDYDTLMQKLGYYKIRTSKGYEAAWGSRRYIITYKKQ